MKTPTTITLIAWNYCNNNCSYCVSESNQPEWKISKKREIWKPIGDESLNYYQLCEKYGFGFHERMCPEPENYFNAKDILDFNYAIKWIKKYRPESHIHISGGEPLLRFDIEEEIKKITDEFITTVVTNGRFISIREKLLDLPLKWLVSYHPTQIPLDEFLEEISLIKNKPHLITTVLTEEMEENNWKAPKEFSEYNFEIKYDKNPMRDILFKYNPEDLNDISSHRILMIQPNGCIVGCNKTHRGSFHRYKSANNIYAMTIDEEDLAINNVRAYNCVLNNRCSAYQTAVKMYNITRGDR
jgi:organic radical activating enzyme